MASNSLCVIVPLSNICFALSISVAAPPEPAADCTYASSCCCACARLMLLGHALVVGDQVDEDAEEGQHDHEDQPEHLREAGQVVPAEDVTEDGDQQPEPGDPDEEHDLVQNTSRNG